MSNNIDMTKPSDTTNFEGFPPPQQMTSGTQQVGGWADSSVGVNVEVVQGVPAASRVTVSGTGVVRVGPNQYSLRITLGNSSTLVGGLTDAQNNVVSPVSSGLFVYGSRQRLVATIDPPTGVISTTGIGSCELTVRYPKGQVNSNFPGATSVIGAGFIEATVVLTVTNT